MMKITATRDHNGKLAYEAIARGTAYYLRNDTFGRWELSSRRLALGGRGIGSVRYFSALADVGKAVKAFAGIEILAV